MAALCATAALAVTGCGGDDEEEPAPAPEQAQTDTGGLSDTNPGADTADAGREIFTGTCGGCHTLKAADTSGQTGPNLDELKPDAERVKTAIAEGPGIMPENLVEGPEADQVAAFVAESAGS